MATGGKIVRVVIKAEDQVSDVFRQMQRQLDRIERAVTSTNRTVQRMGSTAATQYSQISQGASNATRSQNQYAASVARSLNPLKQLTDAAKSLVVTYLGMNAAQSIIETSDAVTQATARLNLFNDGLQTTAELTDMIYESAQRSRGSYLDMMDLVSKYSAVAGDKFGSTENVVAFTETLQKMFTVSGATGQEIYSAALQLKQALGTGRLMGEEFRAVSEAAPLYAKAIAEYMGVSVGELKQLAADSKITSEIMIGAMFAAADDINAKFKEMPYTFEQTWTMMKNTVVRSLDEVWKKLSNILSMGELTKFFNAFGNVIVIVATLMVYLLDATIKVFNFIADHWSLIVPIIIPIIAVLTIYLAILIAMKAKLALVSVWSFILTTAKYGLATSIGTLITMYTGLNAVTATWIAWIVIAIAILYIVIAVINKVAGTSISATGIIVGVIAVAIAIIWNLFLAILDWILAIINTIANKFIAFANFFGNLFRDPIASIIHLFGDFADNILGVIEGIAKALDKVFGFDLAKGVKGWRKELNAKVEVAANKYGNGSYEKVVEEWNLSSESLGLSRWEYGDAWNSGYKLGEGIENKLFSGIGDMGLDAAGSGVTDWEEFANQLGLDSIAGDVGDIADNTSISSEDLKAMRRAAEQKAINRFTTAEIKIDMQNSNTITGTQDIDGIVHALEEKLYETMSVAAEGVHI